ncbi:MAG TPA: trehalose-phosphatase [Anaeromyxobacteraceae bacterium]|nr:trehalose-phosphatase [Anaeromyxobacteraceae bacterium]
MTEARGRAVEAMGLGGGPPRPAPAAIPLVPVPGSEGRAGGDLLSPRNRPLLEELARGRLLVAFDYDGVLAPLARTPDGARMRPGTRRLLRRVSLRYPVAVVSGRAYRDLKGFVGEAAPVLVGNHGFELGREVKVPKAVLERVQGWRRELAPRLARIPGAYVEDKRSTLSVHYGLSPRPALAGAAVVAATQALHGARLVPGKKVVNVLPAHFPTKGDAVRVLLARGGLETALYLGDDVTDEDVFALGEPAVVGVRVGPGRTLAAHRLRSQAEVDGFLEILVALRRPARAAPARRRRVRT